MTEVIEPNQNVQQNYTLNPFVLTCTCYFATQFLQDMDADFFDLVDLIELSDEEEVVLHDLGLMGIHHLIGMDTIHHPIGMDTVDHPIGMDTVDHPTGADTITTIAITTIAITTTAITTTAITTTAMDSRWYL